MPKSQLWELWLYHMGMGIFVYYWGRGYSPNFLHSVIFQTFQYWQSTRYLLSIMFIFDRCRRSSPAVTPVKYKCNSNNPRGTFARSKILLTEKLTNEALLPSPLHSYEGNPWVTVKMSRVDVTTFTFSTRVRPLFMGYSYRCNQKDGQSCSNAYFIECV